MKMPSQANTPVLAAAQSIYACGCMLLPSSSVHLLLPKLLPNNEISFGDIVHFKKEKFCTLVESGFALPKISKFLTSPYQSIRVLAALFRIGRLYQSKNNKASVPILLRGSLGAICTYMNYHQGASRIFESELTCSLGIKILETDTNFMIYHQKNIGWSVKIGGETDSSSAQLIFQNTEIAHQAALGDLDSWIALTKGDVQLSGRIPMLDKFGYVARIAQSEVPSPK